MVQILINELKLSPCVDMSGEEDVDVLSATISNSTNTSYSLLSFPTSLSYLLTLSPYILPSQTISI